MKILITGSLGHIGSKLIRFLPSNINNVEIYMLDCFITNRYTSLFNLPKNVNYKFFLPVVGNLHLGVASLE